MNSQASPNPSDFERPLSYADLRRFLFLISALLLGGLLVAALAKILLLFTIVFFLAMVLNPLVTWLEKRGLRRGMGVAAVMLGLIGIIIGIGFLIVPPMLEEVNGLVSKGPSYRESIESQLERLTSRYPSLQRAVPGLKSLDSLGPQLEQFARNYGPGLGGQILTRTLGALGGLFFGVLALLLTSFVLINPRPLVAGFLAAVPERHREATGRSMARMSEQMVGWIRATLINGLITGISTGLLMMIIGVQPALVFGTLSFFGEFVPNIGPVVAALPALFVAAGLGMNKLLLAAAAILFVQQVESNFLVPYIMGREMELHPVTIVFFALGMGTLFGFAGAVLAVPAAALVKILFDEFYLKPNRVPVGELEERSGKIITERQWPEAEQA